MNIDFCNSSLKEKFCAMTWLSQCVVLLGKTLYSLNTSLYPRLVYSKLG